MEMITEKAKQGTLAIMEIETPDGIFLAYYSDKGLAGLDFPTGAHPGDSGDIETAGEWHKIATAAVLVAAAGKQWAQLPPLDLSAGTDFQRRVWQELLKIPFGQTKTYGELAVTLGNPSALRAVGGACGANPIPLLIPCHRILAAGGKIGGFSSDMKWKRRLLERESNEFFILS